jgi:Pregnancy-associated plasma protein-A/Secretion system C-terminal sorting domain
MRIIVFYIFCLVFTQKTFAQSGDTIPVVVHIMYTNDPLTNPTDEQVKAAIDTLNRIYNGTFRPNTINTGIQFKLAVRDTLGNCTNGITRVNMSVNNNYVSNGVRINTINPLCGISEFDIKANRWNPSKYLNVWLVNKIQVGVSCIDAEGYVTSFPIYDSLKDGIILKYTSIANLSNTTSHRLKTNLAHEVGHYLGLYHVFEDNDDFQIICPANSNCLADGDKICDTDPVTEITNQNPRTGINQCNGNYYSDFTEMNLMSYTNEPTIITPDQKDRMSVFLHYFQYRQSLITNNDALLPISDLLITEQNNYNYQVLPNTAVNILVKYKETNNSSTLISGNRVVSFHLSQDNILTPGNNGDIFLGDTIILSNLNPQSSSPLMEKQIQLPVNLQLGQYYIFISADALNNITECIEDNNFSTAFLYVTSPQSVATYKYWFDDNYTNAVTGFGGFSANNNVSNQIATTSLSNGIHQLNIMFKELGAGWSSVSSTLFYKQQINIQGAAKYQYWFDNNFTNRVTQNIPLTNNYDFNSNISIPNTLTIGQHTLNFRFKIEGGEWSVVSSSLFNYGGTLPLKLLSFTATTENCNSVKLIWETTNEINFDKFIIQQSIDGINYIDANSVNSNNNTGLTKKYIYSFSLIENGTYFYRLKQLDRDGSFSYSPILKQQINCHSKRYSISPNPTSGTFMVNGIANNKYTIKLFSISGQTLKIWKTENSNIYSIETFPNGVYILKIDEEYLKIIKN